MTGARHRSYGRAAALAEDAADELAEKGSAGRVEVISLGLIKPMDKEAVLRSARKTGRVLIIQDEPPWGGYAPYVRCLLNSVQSSLAATPRIIAGADPLLPYWDEQPFLPGLERVATAIHDMIG